MGEFTIKWWLAAIFGLVFGSAVAFVKQRFKCARDMAKNTNDRLDRIEKTLYLLLKRDIVATYEKYKAEKRIPIYEMEAVEETYKEYAVYDDNGLAKVLIEKMRTWAVSEERE